jgi:hypothetical protein
MNDKPWWEIIDVPTAAPNTNTTTEVKPNNLSTVAPSNGTSTWDASYSYWILLVGAHQVITFGFAQGLQFLVVSFTLKETRSLAY